MNARLCESCHSVLVPYKPAAHSNGKFLYLCYLVAFSNDHNDKFPSQQSLYSHPTFQENDCMGANLYSVIEMNGMSNETLVEFFSNGLGLKLTLEEGTLLKGVTETKKSKASFRNAGKWTGLT
jgi:hypothetical protein